MINTGASGRDLGRYPAGVVSMIFALTARYRRPVLAGALVVAAALVAVRLAVGGADEGAGDVVESVMLLAILTPIVVRSLTRSLQRPAGLVVERAGPGFVVPLGVGELYLTLCYVFFAARLLGEVPAEPGDGGWQVVEVGLAAVLTPLVALDVVRAWRGVQVRLRPDGLHWPATLGSLTVPWDALAPGRPLPAEASGSLVALTYARPELVRRHGLVSTRRLVDTGAVEPQVLAEAIRCYVDNPEHRAAIGTEAERRRLLAAA